MKSAQQNNVKKTALPQKKRYIFTIIPLIVIGFFLFARSWLPSEINDVTSNIIDADTNYSNRIITSADSQKKTHQSLFQTVTIEKKPTPLNGDQPGRVKLNLHNVRSDSAVQQFAEVTALDLQILSYPDRHITTQLQGESLNKALTKLAEAMQLPLINMSNVETEKAVHKITLTKGGLIAGDVTDEIANLINNITDSQFEVDGMDLTRVDLLSELSEIENPSFEQLYIDLLINDHDNDVRAEAANALSTAESTEAFQALVDTLSDSNSWVVDNVRAVIAWLGPEKMEPYLRAKINSPDANARAEAEDILNNSFNLEVSLAID